MDDDRIPKYFVLKKDLIRKIEMEEYLSNELIPSERELIDQYKVSRITVRKAVDELVNEGYLYRVQGKGTYVKSDEDSQDLFAITSCTEDVIRLGRKPSKKIMEQGFIFSDIKRARILNLTTEDRLFRMGRVTYADDEPLNYTLTYLPEKIYPGIDQYDFEKESLYRVIAEVYGVKIVKARRTIEAVIPRDEIAEYLDMEEDMPVILFGCTTYGIVNGKEVPIECFKCYYRTDKFKFYINQVGGNEL